MTVAPITDTITRPTTFVVVEVPTLNKRLKGDRMSSSPSGASDLS
jgi:hypothetical protein